MFTSGQKPAGPTTCDRGQIRTGTRPPLDEEKEKVDNVAALTRTGAMFIPLWRVDQMLMSKFVT